MQNLELLNANGLDESILNTYSSCCGIDGDDYSNGEGITPEQAKQAADLALKGAEIVKGLKKPKTDFETELKAVCGRKPIKLLSLGKKGKEKVKKYEACAAKFNAQKNAPASAPAPSPLIERLPAPKEEEKFLGMPKAVGITVTIVGGLALLVGGFFLVKKLRK
jgi:hypothetical protein